MTLFIAILCLIGGMTVGRLLFWLPPLVRAIRTGVPKADFVHEFEAWHARKSSEEHQRELLVSIAIGLACAIAATLYLGF